jgi:hypothetical protein
MSGGLLRYQVFLAYGGAFMALWYAALQNKDAIMEATGFPVATDLAVQWAPLWGILGLGLYAAISIIYGLLTFEDYPEAAAELERQVEEARAEMKRRGILM